MWQCLRQMVSDLFLGFHIQMFQLPAFKAIMRKTGHVYVLAKLGFSPFYAQGQCCFIVTKQKFKGPFNFNSLHETSISLSNVLKDIPSLAMAPHARNSASIVDKGDVGCLQPSQLTASPKQTKAQSVQRRRMSLHAAEFALHHTCTAASLQP
jgi:hypothetical protein